MTNKIWLKLDRSTCAKVPCALMGNDLQLCRLHGAAPDLLEVCHELAQTYAKEIGVPLDQCVGAYFKKYRAAIEKATGGKE